MVKYFWDKAGECTQVQLLTLIPASLENVMPVFTSRLLVVVSNINTTVWGPVEIMLWNWPVHVCEVCQLDLLLEILLPVVMGLLTTGKSRSCFLRLKIRCLLVWNLLILRGSNPVLDSFTRTQTDLLWTHPSFATETLPVSITVQVLSSCLRLKIQGMLHPFPTFAETTFDFNSWSTHGH